MRTLLVVSALLFVLSVFTISYVNRNAVGRDAGPPESMLYVAGGFMFVLSLTLFGVALGLAMNGAVYNG